MWQNVISDEFPIARSLFFFFFGEWITALRGWTTTTAISFWLTKTIIPPPPSLVCGPQPLQNVTSDELYGLSDGIFHRQIGTMLLDYMYHFNFIQAVQNDHFATPISGFRPIAAPADIFADDNKCDRNHNQAEAVDECQGAARIKTVTYKINSKDDTITLILSIILQIHIVDANKMSHAHQT